MYKNPGKTIKRLTKVIVGVGMALSIVAGLAFLAMPGGFFVGLLVAALGCLLSWLSGLTLAAYGDIADNLLAIRNKIVGQDVEAEYVVEAAEQAKVREELFAEGTWECVSCKTQNPTRAHYCVKCGTNKDWSEEKSKK